MHRVAAFLLALASVGPFIAPATIAAAWADDPAKPALQPVRVQTVSFSPAEDSVSYPGTVQARVQASLGFRIGGKVTERLVDIGDHVTAGQLLAQLDPTDPRLALQSDVQMVRAAEAEAVNARADFQRYQRIGRASPAFLPSEFDKRQAALDGAEARLAQAQKQTALASSQLDYTRLPADADGVITDVKLEVGQVVTAGQTVFVLAHTAETEIVVDVPENRLPDIRAADTVSIRLWSQPDHVLAGRVREIGALADAVSRTFAVKVTVLRPVSNTPISNTPIFRTPSPSTSVPITSVPNTLGPNTLGPNTLGPNTLGPNTLGLGMTASVRFAHASGHSVARLPASAIVSVDGVPSVWVLDPAAHRAVAHPVQVAAWSGDGDVLVSTGIDNGAQVVTAGAAMLDATTPVTAWVGAIR
jgi:multidrug efflux system membrane fusion protein